MEERILRQREKMERGRRSEEREKSGKGESREREEIEGWKLRKNS